MIYLDFNLNQMAESHTQSKQLFEEDSYETLKRDLLGIVTRAKYTLLMLPGDRQEAITQLKQWDLWGPLVICFIFMLGIGIEANHNYVYDSFVNVFLIFWVGSFLVAVNCRLLGNKGSIFQSISVIGYCMLPLTLLGFVVSLISGKAPSVVCVLLVLIGLVWSVVSCVIVMRDLVSQRKKYLCAYPIFLFYVFLAWYAIVA